jgi:arachidonate 5-lipoxygenase
MDLRTLRGLDLRIVSASPRKVIVKVILEKSNDHLGLRFEKEDGRIVVTSISPGGPAEAAGTIQLGDELLQINNLHMEGKRLVDCQQLLQAAQGKIMLSFATGDRRPMCQSFNAFVNAHIVEKIGWKPADNRVTLLSEEEGAFSPGKAAATKLLAEEKITQDQYVCLLAQDQFYYTRSMHAPAKEVEHAGCPRPEPTPLKSKALEKDLEDLLDNMAEFGPLPLLTKAPRWQNFGKQLWAEVYGTARKSQFPGEPRKSFLNSIELDKAINKNKAMLVGASTSTGVALSGVATVNGALELPENSFFAAGHRFIVQLRHSNTTGIFDHDGGLEPRGCEIKLVSSYEQPSLGQMDFVLNTGELAEVFNLESLSSFVMTQISGSDAHHRAWLRKHPSALEASIGGYKRAPISYTHLHYYSQTVFEFKANDGKKRYCKWRCVPLGGGTASPVGLEQSGLPGKVDQAKMAIEHSKTCGAPLGEDQSKSATYLTDELSSQLVAGPIKWRLQIQLLESKEGFDSHEIFNPTRAWDAKRCPFIDVMTLELDTILDSKEAGKLEFDISRSPDVIGIVPAHHPSDYNSINVTRVEVHAAAHAVRKANLLDEPGEDESSYILNLRRGGRSGGGACEKLWLQLFGTQGDTAAFALESPWQRVHSDGSLLDCFAVNAKNVGDIVGARLGRDPTSSHDYYLDWMEVGTDKLQCPVRLMCCRWLMNDGPVLLFNAAAGVPDEHAPAISELRMKHLEAMERVWGWSTDRYDTLPLHSAETSMVTLPREQQLEDQYISFGLTDLEGQVDRRYLGASLEAEAGFDQLLNFDFKRAANPLCVFAFGQNKPTMWEPINRSSQFDELRDFSSPELFTNLECPESASRWNSDIEFADRFINGTNPLCLERLSVIPKKLRVTNRMVQDLLPKGTSLEEQVAAGLVYYIDHGPAIGGVPLWNGSQGHACTRKTRTNDPQPDLSTRRRYAPPAQALFHVHPSAPDGKARLMPLAIQLETDKNAPVFTPHEGWDWTVAKLFFMVTDTQVHQFVSHFFSTHLAMEPLIISQLQSLAPCHPVSKLMYHHTRGTVAVNTLGRNMLAGPGGFADAALAVGGGGHIKMMSRYYSSFDFNRRFMLPRFLKSRGLHDPEKLPNYHYRDDGMQIWEAIHHYVDGFLRLHYSSDDSVQNDNEVQNWIRGIHEYGLRAAKGVPGPYLASVKELANLVTCFIFQVSCGHAAVNSPQWESYAHALSRPCCAVSAPPRKKGECTVQTVIKMMPEMCMVRQQLQTAHARSIVAENQCYLGQYPQMQAIFGRTDEQRLVAQFQAHLADIDQQIKARADAAAEPLAASGDTYQHLRPSRVPNSIAK